MAKPTDGAFASLWRSSIIPLFMAAYAQAIHLLVAWALSVEMDPFDWRFWLVGGGIPFLLATLALTQLGWLQLGPRRVVRQTSMKPVKSLHNDTGWLPVVFPALALLLIVSFLAHLKV